MFNWLLRRDKKGVTHQTESAKTLCDVCEGEKVQIECLQGDVNECNRLREMGLGEKSKVEKIAGKETLICRVCDAKVVISHGLAKNIIVSKCDENDLAKGEKIILLSELEQGQEGVVHNFTEESDSCARLEEMGLTPNERVQVIRYAPLGDPIEIKIRGYHLSLRKNEAELIQVRVK